jgi:hypothetical protein
MGASHRFVAVGDQDILRSAKPECEVHHTCSGPPEEPSFLWGWSPDELGELISMAKLTSETISKLELKT